jgi:hypothetical protein
MIPSSVTFSHGGRRYTFAEDAEKVMKGKLACDCTKSLLIREYCDRNFPILKCGQTIELLSIEDIVAEPATVLH